MGVLPVISRALGLDAPTQRRAAVPPKVSVEPRPQESFERAEENGSGIAPSTPFQEARSPSHAYHAVETLSPEHPDPLGLRALWANRPASPQEILDRLGRVPTPWGGVLADEYRQGAGVWEGYSLEQHHRMVLEQSRAHITQVPGMDRAVFELTLALHDAGKAAAIRNGGKALQHEYTLQLLDAAKDYLPVSPDTLATMKALIDGDPLGQLFRGRIKVGAATREVRAMAAAAGMAPLELLQLLVAFYQCDASSYTRQAGGQRSLEEVFAVRPDGVQLEHDKLHGRLEFSRKNSKLLSQVEQLLTQSVVDDGERRLKSEGFSIKPRVVGVDAGGWDRYHVPWFHATSSEAWEGIAAAQGLVPSSQLQAQGIEMKAGEAIQRGTSGSIFLSFGEGASGYGVARAYFQMQETSPEFCPANHTDEGLAQEIGRLRAALTHGLDISLPGTWWFRARSRGELETRLQQLEREQASREAPSAAQGPYPIMLQLDGESASKLGHAYGGQLPGERRLGASVPLEQVERIFVPAENVADMQRRLQAVVGSGGAGRVYPIESMDALAARHLSSQVARVDTLRKLRRIERLNEERLHRLARASSSSALEQGPSPS